MIEWYLRKKQTGRCVRCGAVDENVASGKVYCRECTGKMLAAQKERRAYLKAQKRCIHCGGRDGRTEAGSVVCVECARKIKEQPATHRKEERYKARMKELRAQRKELHVCTKCGGTRDEEGFLMCSACRLKQREYRMTCGSERD